MRKTNGQSKNHQQGKEPFMVSILRLKQLLSGDSTPQMCRQSTADLFRRKFVIFLAIHKVCQRKTAFFRRKVSG